MLRNLGNFLGKMIKFKNEIKEISWRVCVFKVVFNKGTYVSELAELKGQLALLCMGETDKIFVFYDWPSKVTYCGRGRAYRFRGVIPGVPWHPRQIS